MPIRVEIAGETRSASEADAQWINQQINRRRRDGLAVCVRVTIEDSAIHLTLSTRGCPVGDATRRANVEERPIIDLWRKHHLDQDDFTGGDVVAFLKQLNR